MTKESEIMLRFMVWFGEHPLTAYAVLFGGLAIAIVAVKLWQSWQQRRQPGNVSQETKQVDNRYVSQETSQVDYVEKRKRERQEKVIRLRDDGMTVPEIARKVGCSEGTVKRDLQARVIRNDPK